MNTEPKKFYRSRKDRMVAGIIGGFAKFLGIDSTLLRVIFVILAFTTMGGALIMYLVLILVIPKEPIETNTKQ